MALQSTTVIDEPNPLASRQAGAGVSRRQRGFPRWLLPIIIHVAMTIGEVLVWVARRLSRSGALRLARWVTIRLEPLTRERRQNNMRLFFRTKRMPSPQDALDRSHLDALARMRMEVVRYSDATPEFLRENAVLKGEEHLREVLGRGRGALIVSGHTATWWYVPVSLAVRGYPVTAIFTPITFPRVERRLLGLAKKYNIRIAFVGRDAYKAARRAIERNEILYLTFDVTVRTNRAQYLPFGDGGLHVDAGPAIMAARHAMPTLQAGCTYLDPERSCVSIYPPEAAELAPQTISAEDLCRLWTERLEKEVCLRPEEWWPWGYAGLREKSTAQLPGSRRVSPRFQPPEKRSP